jgi:peptidyl-tRNA hydrolase, PTH1 family
MLAGLGNPGAQYSGTRHNLGYEVIDRIAGRLGADRWREKYNGLIAETVWRGEKLLLVKPQTFMNRSGGCVAPAAKNRIFRPEDILTVVDDVNLSLGRLRFRAGGSAGGHNGLKSVIERLGSRDFHRLRLGVSDNRGADPDLAGYVLSKFRPDERDAVEAMVARAAEGALCWAEYGIEKAMDRYNRPVPEP